MKFYVAGNLGKSVVKLQMFSIMKGEKYKSSEKIGVKYIQTWEEKSIERNEACEEGRAAGLKEALGRMVTR